MQHLGKSPKTDNLYNLGKARSASGPSSPPDPNAYAFYINKEGNLVLIYREYIPNFTIVDGNLIYTHTAEAPEAEPTFSINAKGYLIKTNGEGMSQNIGRVVGLSAYEIAKKNGFSGTEAEWLDSLQAPDVTPPMASKTIPGLVYAHFENKDANNVSLWLGDQPIQGV